MDRCRTLAMRDQAWAVMRDNYEQLTRIADGCLFLAQDSGMVAYLALTALAELRFQALGYGDPAPDEDENSEVRGSEVRGSDANRVGLRIKELNLSFIVVVNMEGVWASI